MSIRHKSPQPWDTRSIDDRQILQDPILPKNGYQNTRCNGNDNGWNLGNQTIADGKNGVGLQSLGHRQVELEITNQNSAYDIDDGDKNPSDGISPDELAGSVHGTVKIGILLNSFLFSSASASVMTPEFISASMDICLPGMASR